jgi:hypothetical protein
MFLQHVQLILDVVRDIFASHLIFFRQVTCNEDRMSSLPCRKRGTAPRYRGAFTIRQTDMDVVIALQESRPGP